MYILILKLPYIIENINSENYLRFHQPEITIINILVAVLFMEFFIHTEVCRRRITLYIHFLHWNWLPLIF